MAVTTRRSRAKQAASASSASTGALFCVLLALQYGLQPFLKVFIAPEVNKVSLVLTTELTKIFIACALMAAEGSFARNFAGWNLRAASLSVLPALIYAAQNYLLVVGYQSMDSVTFNCLNQSKLVSTALFVYLIFGVKQSYPQLIALAGLLAAGVVLQDPPPSSPSPSSSSSSSSSSSLAASVDFRAGVAAVLAASAMSGLASAAVQLALQRMRRSSNALTIEMASAAIPVLYLANGSADPSSMYRGWTLATLVPVTTSALGGIFVGQVTKHLGGIAKGFAIVAGLVFTGVAQSIQRGSPLETRHLAGLALVVSCTWAHAAFPPKPAEPARKKTKRS